jgi:expansin (peptidoglycan-binding protein)
MNASNRSTQRRKPGRPIIPVTAAAIVVAGLVAVVVSALLPDHQAKAGYAAATPSAGSYTAITAGAGSATATAQTATASATAKTQPSATARAKSSATSSPRAVSGPAPLAGRIRPGVTYHGVATEYEAADGNGACLFGPAADMMIAAMNETDYETAKACGAYVRVRASNGASVTVLITNECPLPCAPGQIDLSRQAFAKIADPKAGRITITWSLLSPGSSKAVSLRYKSGSSQYWCGIQVIGHRNPVALLEVRVGGGWRQLSRTGYNYFLSTSGSGCGGAIRITDIYGQKLTVNGIALKPDVAQQTQVQFSQH